MRNSFLLRPAISAFIIAQVGMYEFICFNLLISTFIALFGSCINPET